MYVSIFSWRNTPYSDEGVYTVRNDIYEIEKKMLCEKAFFSQSTAGRLRPHTVDDMRTDFMRDRDKIIHAKSFRRLMHKMQVFLAPEGDHYRTRLTHTLEVAQIARSLARNLRLNEDLTEAAALGHDLGHTPFGHSGERALNEICPHGFRHNEQSLRVADKLENLNLTIEVRDAIVNHTGSRRAFTLEGQIIKFADRIAYINHDIDDAIRAGILNKNDLPKHLTDILGDTHSDRIDTMIRSVVANGVEGDIGFTSPYGEATMELREFMFATVYRNSKAKSEDDKVVGMIQQLYEYYTKNIDKLPEEYSKHIDEDGIEKVACDYIACMTDRYALAKYEELFIPKVWQYK